MALHYKRRAMLQFAVGAGAALAAPAIASGWPSRPVRVIVPFPPGQATDVVMRIVAARLAAAWKQDVVIENHAGDSGIPAMVAGKQATADGYTLTAATSGTLAVNPALFPALPYQPLTDFIAVGSLFKVPLIVAGHPAMPALSFNDFIALVRREPGKHAYASTGRGSIQYLAMELLKLRAGLDMPHVPHIGSAAALAALEAGKIGVIKDSAVALMAAIRASTAKPFGVTTARRALPPLDFIPTIADTVTGFDVSGWGGIVAPARTPPEIVVKVAIDIQAVLREPATRRAVGDSGATPAGGTSAEFSSLIRREIETWAQAVREAGIKPN